MLKNLAILILLLCAVVSGVAHAAPADQNVLLGRWIRPDGGQILQVMSIDGAGKMEVLYFDPQPIYVSKAEVRGEDGKLRIAIHLKDVGYSSNYYSLTYYPKTDLLEGVYYHPGSDKEHNVFFMRN